MSDLSPEKSKSEGCCPSPMIRRRQFVKAVGVTAAIALADPSKVMAGPFKTAGLNHVIPVDKKLSKAWIESLYARGEPLTASGNDLNFIGMPISGIATGQVYLSGDGRLWYWNLTAKKDKKNNPKGLRYMDPDEAVSPAGQGFALQVNGKVHSFDAEGFEDVRFTNRCPMARVNYADSAIPVKVQLDAYTPFIPLKRDDSSYPVIVMRYTMTNTSEVAQDLAIAGWIKNNADGRKHSKVNVYREFENIATVECTAEFEDANAMAIGIFGNEKPAFKNLTMATPDAESAFESDSGVKDGKRVELDGKKKSFASIGQRLSLQPGESKTVSFAVSWRYPLVQYGTGFGNGKKAKTLGKNHYATVWPTAAEASSDLANREAELYGQTKQWTDTWYDSTLPYWLLERSFIPINSMQTQVAQRVISQDKKSNFYNLEEGVRCCPGNCTHVWNYAQGLSRIFPVIERECRDRVEYGLGFDKKTGSIAHRYQKGRFKDAIDGNCGTILRVLRESQMTTDYRFLESIWDRVKLSMDHVIETWDSDEDGMLSGAQHNTLDEPWFGQVHWLINVYHASLKAAAVMARQMKQPQVARRYEQIVAKGVPAMVDLLWNEDFGYFIHKPGDPDDQKHGSTNGCHIDQVLGDSWLMNVGIEPSLPKDKIRKSLESLWKYNFTPDVGAFRDVMTNGRYYAAAGDAGLVMCSFPYGKIEPKSGKESYAGYLNECMTGFEWQVAAHMIWEGLIEEGLAIGKAIHDRYQPAKRNPYNEIECSDHYSRAMASYGTYIAACGYKYDGPEAKLAFGPRLNPDDFRGAFTTAQGWGSFTQQVVKNKQSAGLELRYGQLVLKEFSLDAVDGTAASGADVKLDDQQVAIKFEKTADKYVIKFAQPITIKAGQKLEISM